MSAPSTACRVLGIDCFVGDIRQAAVAAIDRARSGEGGFVSLMNVHVAMTAQRDTAVFSALERAWRVFPDGAPIAWLERKRGAAYARRVAGPDLMLEVLRHGRESGLRHFLFGSTPDVLAAMANRLRQQMPDLKLVGTVAPPRGDEHDENLLDEVRSAAPDIVWLGLGAPKQELWAHRHADSLKPALVIGVGAAFDFHAGAKRRAPGWMQRAGLEWLHRLVSEPRRLGWRYLSTNTRFTFAALRDIAQR
jgi:N-acetylglucosaminyldiphosphoundecaprenol N-acetyl-beta-D-mannosaminyltransferase